MFKAQLPVITDPVSFIIVTKHFREPSKDRCKNRSKRQIGCTSELRARVARL
ncbi:hypothetical protein K503DRAFT_767486 [Rhizopogon vinicolor AM-OR11-026]|uniref:Uncharacterized protein n=1 Tax=Rhizopogon vinicolor AM-OR11-026 TaxID=1314800 RepID=A0A1B7MJY6_9AGAM|nr:hypothetical protein K503DRAFT_776174 [Rhizopogon vinicolor AM-OR11-026]OAX41684.1 hypothetical protein K503DRAFT_767486 [Rhizopogon vinicolor AM-OR11-026]